MGDASSKRPDFEVEALAHLRRPGSPTLTEAMLRLAAYGRRMYAAGLREAAQTVPGMSQIPAKS